MKKNEIYMIRHGETIWNQEKLLQGRQDISLSEKGIAQAYEMSAYFKTRSLDFVGASPLIRTQQTATILSNELNVPLKTIEELKARHYGPWEGKNIDAIRKEHQELFLKLSCYSREEVFSNPPLESIESYQSVSNRALKPLYQIEGNALLVTHSGVMTSILLALKFPYPQIPLFEQTGYIKLSLEEGRLVIEEVQGLVESRKLISENSREPIFIF